MLIDRKNPEKIDEHFWVYESINTLSIEWMTPSVEPMST
jgi:hypothetical protein